MDPGSFAVIVTHGHVHDEEVLTELTKMDPTQPYIGMIGSRNKAFVITEKLKDAGVETGNVYDKTATPFVAVCGSR